MGNTSASKAEAFLTDPLINSHTETTSRPLSGPVSSSLRTHDYYKPPQQIRTRTRFRKSPSEQRSVQRRFAELTRDDSGNDDSSEESNEVWPQSIITPHFVSQPKDDDASDLVSPFSQTSAIYESGKFGSRKCAPQKRDTAAPWLSVTSGRTKSKRMRSGGAVGCQKDSVSKSKSWMDSVNAKATRSVRPKFVLLGPPPPAGSSARYTVLRDADALIATLSGMRHTARHPIWVDASCDGLLFEEIAAHIRPRIHPLTVEDCIAADCREKQEIFDHYLFMCIRASHSGVRVAIIVFKTIIITYHCGECDIMDGTREALVKRHFPSLTRSKWLCPGPGWVTHAIIDAVVDALIPEVNRVVREVRNVEQLVFMLSVDSQSELLSRIQMARVSLALYRHRLWPKSTLTYNLNNKMWRAFLQHVPAPYWRDVNDHVSRMVDSLQLSLDTLEQLQQVFVAKVSLEMARDSNRLDKAAGALETISVVFLPMVLVTGVFGMNCWVPFQHAILSAMFYPKNHEYIGYVLSCVIMILSSVISYALVKHCRKK